MCATSAQNARCHSRARGVEGDMRGAGPSALSNTAVQHTRCDDTCQRTHPAWQGARGQANRVTETGINTGGCLLEICLLSIARAQCRVGLLLQVGRLHTPARGEGGKRVIHYRAVREPRVACCKTNACHAGGSNNQGECVRSPNGPHTPAKQKADDAETLSGVPT